VFTTDWVSWQQSRRSTNAEIPLEGAVRAEIRIAYGAAVLTIGPGDDPDVLLDGSFGGGVERRVTRADDGVSVRLALPRRSSILNPRFPWAWGLVTGWQLGLARAVPIDLEVEMSGGLGSLDLEHLRIERLDLTCPGSQVEVTLPATGRCNVDLRAKAAMVVLRVPDGMAASLRATSAGAIEADIARFPLTADGEYRSPDFETAADRVDIRAELPAGSLTLTGPTLQAEPERSS
jgi:hypothetical protein